MKTIVKLLALLLAVLFLCSSCLPFVTTDEPSAGNSSAATPSVSEPEPLPAHIRYYNGAYYFYPPFTNKELDTHDDEFAALAVFSVKSVKEMWERLVEFGPDVTGEQLYFFKVSRYLPGVGYKMPYANLLNDEFYTLPLGAVVKEISLLQGSECTVKIQLNTDKSGEGDSMVLEWASYPEIVETAEHFLDPKTKLQYGENPSSMSVTVNGCEGIRISANNLYSANSSYYTTEKNGVTYFVTITTDMNDETLSVMVDRYAASGRYRYIVSKPTPQTVARCVELDPFTPGEPIVQNVIEAPAIGAFPDIEQIPARTAPEGVIFTKFEKGNLGFGEWVIGSYAKDFAYAESYSAFWQAYGYSLFEETYLDDFYHRHEYAERLNAQNVYHGCGAVGESGIAMSYSFTEVNTQTGSSEKVGYEVRYYTVTEGDRTYYLKKQVRDKDQVCTLLTVQYVENGQLFGYTAEMPDSYYVDHFSEFNPFK